MTTHVADAIDGFYDDPEIKGAMGWSAGLISARGKMEPVDPDPCAEDDEDRIRALLASHGFDPDNHPRVCELGGVPVDGHEDQDGACVRCGRVRP